MSRAFPRPSFLSDSTCSTTQYFVHPPQPFADTALAIFLQDERPTGRSCRSCNNVAPRDSVDARIYPPRGLALPYTPRRRLELAQDLPATLAARLLYPPYTPFLIPNPDVQEGLLRSPPRRRPDTPHSMPHMLPPLCPVCTSCLCLGFSR